MILSDIGLAVVHSLWQGAFIAGVAAMISSLLRESHARARYAIACLSLASMALAAIVTAFAADSAAAFRVRREVMPVVDAAIGPALPAFFYWASIVLPVTGAVWLAGIVMRLLGIAVEWRRARTVWRGERSDPAKSLQAIVDDLRTRLSIRVAVEICRSASAAVPMVLAWRRPLIVLPHSTTSVLSPIQLRSVIAHELAHVRRRDYAVNLLLVVAEAVLFYHPAARWIARRIRTEREYCCDDVAVAIERDADAYARALAMLEDARAGQSLAVAAASGTLVDRIQRIAGERRPTLTPARGVVTFVLMSLVAAAILAMTITVPPSLPWAAEIRRRSALPSGASVAPQRVDGVDASRPPGGKIRRQQPDAR